jgi:cell division protein FtsZ
MGELDRLKFEITDETLGGTRIKVIGVGGGGSNAVGRMIDGGVGGVEFYVMNTDAQALRSSRVPNKMAIGTRITHGLGAGSDPEVGRQAALEDTDRIIEMLEGADMVFVSAGLGGGTGTGAAPVVAALAKELGALTIAVVTKPFSFEGPRRLKQAEKGLAELHATVDTVLSIPNDRLVELAAPGTSFFEAFRLADDVLRQGVQGIADIITTPGMINRDFADVRAIMAGMGFAMMGTATAEGENAAVEAARTAMQCPLLEEGGLKGARAILLNITAPPDLTLREMHEACTLIREATENPEVQINFGLVPDERLGKQVKVTVIATGFERKGLPQVDAVHVSTPVKHAPVQAASAASAAAAAASATEWKVMDPEPTHDHQGVSFLKNTPLPPPDNLVPEDTVLHFDFETEPEQAIGAEPEPETPARTNPNGDVYSLDEFDVPALLRRERKSY